MKIDTNKCYSNNNTFLILDNYYKNIFIKNPFYDKKLKCIIFDCFINYSDFIKLNIPETVYSLKFYNYYDNLIINNLPPNIIKITFCELFYKLENLSPQIQKIKILCDTKYAVKTFIKNVPFGCIVVNNNGKIYLT
jgi:hypothetical protein